MSGMVTSVDDAPEYAPPGLPTPARPWWEQLDRRRMILLMAIEAVVILGIWQLAVGVLGLLNPVFLPDPARIMTGLGALIGSGELVANLGISVVAWVVGFALACVVGVLLGLALGSFVPVNRLAGPIVWTIYATPWLAYRPLSVVWFGFGVTPIIFLVFIASIFPIVFNTAAGVGAVETNLLNAGRIFGAKGVSTYRKIVLPSTIPYVFAGMRQSVVLATIALLVAEMTGSSTGAGALISLKTGIYRTDEAFVAIVIAVLWTVSISQLIKLIGQRIAPWQTDSRA